MIAVCNHKITPPDDALPGTGRNTLIRECRVNPSQGVLQGSPLI